MNNSIKKGFSFGLASGIITTLGLMVGLYSSTHSVLVVISGIIMIAVADSLSDALGIHFSEEFENKHTTKEIWSATCSTFLSKFVFATLFIIPLLLFSLTIAIIVNVIWGLLVIISFSYYMAIQQKKSPYTIVIEHVAIAIFVIIATHFIGNLVAILV
ncbi:hypothetical protein COV17_04415 [Candidatus Woesearchaeota archaeon CG10_big_fil_rev_8_21_14_0_10_36_11]|nr:MAG: hypothetical protein COV17_04415 [Candidatus Woesearchaeota archaeon CG10_big_fil_rev_8_21_14_0_10_36_11]